MASDEASSIAPANAASVSVAENSSRGRGRGRGGGRGGGRGRGKDGQNAAKNGTSGSNRREWANKREEVSEHRDAKRRRVIDDTYAGTSYMSIGFSPDEIAAEERRPKRKVAVIIGYAGTGYHGLQINHLEKTIEGDLFAAFVAAGAISKANANDPKKSSLIRCARTDKGVHAASNVLSLKMIVEDEDIVDKINKHLPDQIRVWGIQRTTAGFNAHQGCDSRWYEYLMPSYALLPPQPQSFLGKKLVSSATEKGVLEEYQERLGDVKGFWEEVQKNDIQPIMEKLDPALRAEVEKVMRDIADREFGDEPVEAAVEAAPAQAAEPKVPETEQAQEGAATTGKNDDEVMADALPAGAAVEAVGDKPVKVLTPLEVAVKEVKAAYIAAKRRYRTTPTRLEALQKALDMYVGTHNFHNYTILKSANDASANRHIKSFKAESTPIHIGDTEWISIKIHGQSFMMHQIRKMIAMAVMVVRCGAPLDLITQSYEHRRISIPKAPGLGLMLERPMFDEMNKQFLNFGRESLDLSKYDDKMKAFKDQHIYKRMFEVEEKENSFHIFFNQVDNFHTDYFLWVTAGGVAASKERNERTERVPRALQVELGDEADGVVETT